MYALVPLLSGMSSSKSNGFLSVLQFMVLSTSLVSSFTPPLRRSTRPSSDGLLPGLLVPAVGITRPFFNNIVRNAVISAGLDPSLNDMLVGESREYANHRQTTVLKKVSSAPPIFLLSNLLSPEQCQAIMNRAASSSSQEAKNSMKPGKTTSHSLDDEKRKNSMVGWLDNNNDELLEELSTRVHEILLPQQYYAPSAVEPLQVVQYSSGGEYVLHHDSKQRILTVLYYLNGVGETWFPLADETDDAEGDNLVLSTRQETLRHCHARQAGEHGVLVSTTAAADADASNQYKVEQGDAVAFFNYSPDGSCDWASIHAGLPVTEEKWIANHWYHLVPFGNKVASS